MSYLNTLRVHFAGRFQAAISTLNNTPTNYNNENPNQMNLGFNPPGSGDWRLIGGQVTGAWLNDGRAASEDDPILEYLIADSDRMAAAKLVDLDSEQQLVSQIWGLEIRICNAVGETLLRGQYEPAAFVDIWDRATGPGTGGDIGAGAMYQSVLSNLEWGNIEHSPFLQQLKVAATEGLLSIKFNVDGINLNSQSSEFMRGRIVGTIGPARADEPHHFVLGRQFMTADLRTGRFFVPEGQINFCVAVVSRESGKIYLDLGNALPTASPGGALQNLGALSLLCLVQDPDDNSPFLIDNIPYTSSEWYQRTAGVVELPIDRRLTEQELQAISQNLLVLMLVPPNNRPIFTAESPGGLFVRADQFVFRLNPGETANVRLIATHWGERYAGARIISIRDPNQLQGPLQIPSVGIPSNAIEFPYLVVTDENGVADLPVVAKEPGNPRKYIDGQVYTIRPVLEEWLTPLNPWSFISLLVWDTFQPDEPPTWHGSMQPIFEQYAKLYPVMRQFLDMSDYEAICENWHLLLLALELDPSNPNYMPVTRDLSGTKRKAILRWLKETGPDGKPLKGTPVPAAPLEVVAGPTLEQGAAATELDLQHSSEGGKSDAMLRRLVNSNPPFNVDIFKQK